jgi:hypothetical protein
VISNETKETIYSLQKEPEVIQHNFFSSQTGKPRHSKQDYEELKKFTFNDIFKEITSDTMKKQVAFKEDKMSEYHDMLKIEQKKKANEQKKAERRQRKEKRDR